MNELISKVGIELLGQLKNRKLVVGCCMSVVHAHCQLKKNLFSGVTRENPACFVIYICVANLF